MVLGDSHYCGTPCGKCGINPNLNCNRLTSDVIGWCLDPNCEREGWMKTYLKFERSLVGHETTPEEIWKIWDSIVFYKTGEKLGQSISDAIDSIIDYIFN